MQAVARQSLRRASLERYFADIAQVLFGFTASVVTARILGPSEKGALSVLLLVCILLSYCGALGLGDAAPVAVGRFGMSFSQVARGSLRPTFLVSLAAIAGLWLTAWVAGWGNIFVPLLLGSVYVPLAATLHLALALTTLAGYHRRATFALVSSSAAIAVLTAILVGPFDLGITGGVAAALVGSVVALCVVLPPLVRQARAVDPLPGYFKHVRGTALGALLGYLLLALSQRLDALLVYGLLGEADAGIYSISLTLSQLVWYVPFAVMAVVYPRLAATSGSDFGLLLGKISRVSLLTALFVAVALGLVAPILVPNLFGEAYSAGAGLVRILSAGSIVWAEHWILSRALVAGGSPKAYVISYAASVLVMILLVGILVPSFGVAGAAIASSLAPLAGVSVSLWHLTRTIPDMKLSSLVPSPADAVKAPRVVLDLLLGRT